MRKFAFMFAAFMLIGINHADQCQFGKVEAFGHKLGADNHVNRARFGLCDKFRRAFGRAERVGCGNRNARLRKQFGHFIRDPFHSRSACDQAICFAAFGAGIGWLCFKPAMVACKARGQAMFDQPRAAIGALKPVPAIAAKRKRGIATAVEE